MSTKPRTFSELFEEAERHEDYWLAGAILSFTESVVREMERQGMTRTELAQRLGATPAYVTKILRGKVNFTLATMMRLARALGAGLSIELTGRTVSPALQSAAAARVASPRKAARAAKTVRAGALAQRN
jgi:transcriptional regulator with XRE-family HTH domain